MVIKKRFLPFLVGALLVLFIPFVKAQSEFEGMREVIRTMINMIEAIFSPEVFASEAAVIGFVRFIFFWVIFCGVYMGASRIPQIKHQVVVVLSIMFSLFVFLIPGSTILRLAVIYKVVFIILLLYLPVLVMYFLMWIMPDTGAGKAASIVLLFITLAILFAGKVILEQVWDWSKPFGIGGFV